MRPMMTVQCTVGNPKNPNQCKLKNIFEKWHFEETKVFWKSDILRKEKTPNRRTNRLKSVIFSGFATVKSLIMPFPHCSLFILQWCSKWWYLMQTIREKFHQFCELGDKDGDIWCKLKEKIKMSSVLWAGC